MGSFIARIRIWLWSQDREGTKNQVADHLSRLEEARRPNGELEINDAFSGEQLLALSNTLAHGITDIAKFLVGVDEIESYQKKKLFREYRQYYWEEPYLFRICADIIRRCVPEDKVMPMLKAYHSSPVGGHYGGNWTTAKVLEWLLLTNHLSGCQFDGKIMWPMPKARVDFQKAWDAFELCNGGENIWCVGIDFMGPFVSSYGMTYILVHVGYVSKWVEAATLPNNEARSVTAFLKKNIP